MGGWCGLNGIKINLPFVVTSLASEADVLCICCMYTFIEAYLQLLVGAISGVFWIHVKAPELSP